MPDQMALRVKKKPIVVQDISTLTADVEAFLDHSRAKGLSPKTVERHYGWSLHKILLPFAEANGITTRLQLTKPALEALAREVNARPLSVSSARTYLKGVNQFAAWLDRDGPRAPMPKKPKLELDVLSSQEIRALEEATPYARDRLIIRLLAETGMREGELASMTVSDIREREHNPAVVVRGKTGERYVPVSRALHDDLKRFAKGRPVGLRTSKLFLGLRRPKGRDPEPLGSNAIYQIVKQAAARLGTERRIYPHLLRHSAITRMANRGVPVATISEICGVSPMVIAQVYSHPSFKDRYEALVRSLQED